MTTQRKSVVFFHDWSLAIAAMVAAALLTGAPAGAEDPADAAVAVVVKKSGSSSSSSSKSKDKKFKPFKEVTKDAKEHKGLFNLYQKDDHLYAVIKRNQLDKQFLAPMAIARGMASAGIPLNFGDEWVLSFRRVGDKIQLVRKNIHYEAPKGTPLAEAVEQNYTDSILMALPILSEDAPGSGLLVDFSQIFLSDFASLGMGSLDRGRSSYKQVKAFENNIELQVEATFRGSRYGSFYSFYDDGVIDRRGVTVVIHYSLTKMPDSGYKPRYADQRVGHFLNATKDFGSKKTDTIFRRRINRWRLEKSNPSAKLSAPKKKIVWWLESNVPFEYRPYVEEGILEWNKAFEKIGFRDALSVRWQQEGEDFNPEDINYCTFRWVTTPYTFAMSGLRSNPITGEMIDGDVVFDASWIRIWKQEYAYLVGAPLPSAEGDSQQPVAPLDVGEVISSMLAAKEGFGMAGLSPAHRARAEMLARRAGIDVKKDFEGGSLPVAVPSSWSPLRSQLAARCGCGASTCNYAVAKREEFRLAAMALAAVDTDKDDDDSDGDEENGEKQKKAELPEELIGQLIKEIVMHEVGHSLGLRHNFKASSMLSLEEINDTEITRERGQVGSVMDYNPVNIHPDPDKQGDYATTTIGPYDYWAIEYAYKPIKGDEAKGLEEIAARSPEPDLTYATDEDLYQSNDPHVNVYDLGDDGLAYGKQRIELAEKLMDDLDERIIEDGDSWARLRTGFSILLGQYGNAAYLASSYIGGQSFAKHHKGDDDTPDPITPVPAEKQREALEFLCETILSDEAFDFSPALLRKLTRESWYHWGSRNSFFSGDVAYPVLSRVSSIQNIALSRCLSSSVLRRLQNQELMTDDEHLGIDEVFRSLTDAVWSELDDENVEISTVRRNLQREHVKRLAQMVVGPRRNPYYDLFSFISFGGGGGSPPADAVSLARLHLTELDEKLDGLLEDDSEMGDTVRAHLMESHQQIERALDAELAANGP